MRTSRTTLPSVHSMIIFLCKYVAVFEATKSPCKEFVGIWTALQRLHIFDTAECFFAQDLFFFSCCWVEIFALDDVCAYDACYSHLVAVPTMASLYERAEDPCSTLMMTALTSNTISRQKCWYRTIPWSPRLHSVTFVWGFQHPMPAFLKILTFYLCG